MNKKVIDCHTIIFDLGGVIEKINPSAVCKAFKSLGMQNPENFFSLLKQSRLCSEFELGHISQDEFIQTLKIKCSQTTSSLDIEQAWSANQLGISQDTLSSLCTLKQKGYRLLLLSNTNPIHSKKIEANFFQKHAQDFRSIFHRIYYSFEIHRRKPTEAVYAHVIEDAKLSPKECLYIDDLESNLIIPKKLGMHCVLHPTNTEIKTLDIFKSKLAQS